MSKKPIVAYHGTSKVFDKFRVPRNKAQGTYGPYLYFAADPAVANEYASAASNKAYLASKKLDADPDHQAHIRTIMERHGVKNRYYFKHPNHEAASEEIKHMERGKIAHMVGEAPNVHKVNLHIENPFNPHSRDHAKKVAAVMGHRHDGPKQSTDQFETNHYEYLIDRAMKTHRNDAAKAVQHVTSAIKQAGFDAIHDKEENSYTVFDAKKVKSFYSPGAASKVGVRLKKARELLKSRLKKSDDVEMPKNVDAFRRNNKKNQGGYLCEVCFGKVNPKTAKRVAWTASSNTLGGSDTALVGPDCWSDHPQLHAHERTTP